MSMEIKLTAFGIAKDILQNRSMPFNLEEGDTIIQLKEKLVMQFSEFSSLASLAFAVNEAYCSDEYTLSSGDHVVIIPPVAGG